MPTAKGHRDKRPLLPAKNTHTPDSLFFKARAFLSLKCTRGIRDKK